MNAIIQLQQVSYWYPQAEQPALRRIDLAIEPGEFVLVLGASGSGKSTFLRALNGLVPRFYGGRISGSVLLAGKPLDALSQRKIVSAVGFLHQDPERQLLLDTVERELVFGMENLGIDPAVMKSRLAEVSHLFGLGPLLARKVATLSGGEKQRVALAGVLTTYPQVLLLDEPTSQLDPVHAEEVLQAVRRLNEDWGITVVLSEHRLERCFHLADRVLLFEQGAVAFDGTPSAFARAARTRGEWAGFLPAVARHLLHATDEGEVPFTIKQARSMVRPTAVPVALAGSGEERKEQKERTLGSLLSGWWGKKERVAGEKRPPLLALERGRVSYDGQADVLRDVTYVISEGDRIALLGENGAGKSTLVKALAGVIPLAAGEVRWRGETVAATFWETAWRQIGYLSQNPNDYLLHDTVEAELAFAVRRHAGSDAEAKAEVRRLLEQVGLADYSQRHPYDLSGGQRQRLTVAALLANRPSVLLLDEPTRGLDTAEKERLCQWLHSLPVEAVLVITHDVEFAAAFANRVSVLYQGQLAADGAPDDVFRQSFYYMPQVYKLYR